VSAARRKAGFLLALCLLCTLLFAALGVWQLERLAWKRDLIARVNQRIHAAPRPAPGPAEWPVLTRRNAEYTRIRIRGVFVYEKETLVQAVTDYGAGYWVVTPLRTDWGIVLVNRGFVPSDRKAPGSLAPGGIAGAVEVEGLLRLTEPGGGFLRHNDPGHDRWYSRDVAAIAAAQGLKGVAPYFIDAGRAPVPGGWPKGGLTVVSFRNAHLAYATTWFCLALLSMGGAAFLVFSSLSSASRSSGG
jgi:surfeit locus 1 family protein